MNVSQATKAIVCSVSLVLGIVANMDTDLKTSPQGLAHIANQEGCRSMPYKCSAGTLTDGLGNTKNVVPGQAKSNEQIAEDFVRNVGDAEDVVNKHLKVSVTQAQFDVMVSFVYNLGRGNFRTSTLLRKFNDGYGTRACREFLRWVYVNGKNCHLEESNCPGIVKRRQVEYKACLNGW